MTRRQTRKDRTGTAHADIKAWTGADISQPPPHMKLDKDEMVFWQSIMQTRATELWTPSDLEFAATLARARARIERLEVQLKMEGDVIENRRGTPVANPLHSILETLNRRCIALARALHVHAEATSGPSRKEKPTNAKASAVRRTKSVEDELLPSLDS